MVGILGTARMVSSMVYTCCILYTRHIERSFVNVHTDPFKSTVFFAFPIPSMFFLYLLTITKKINRKCR